MAKFRSPKAQADHAVASLVGVAVEVEVPLAHQRLVGLRPADLRAELVQLNKRICGLHVHV